MKFSRSAELHGRHFALLSVTYREVSLNFASIDDLQSAMREKRYIAERGLATSLYLALKLRRPLFLEGEAGVGKTEVAKIVAELLDTELIRLQCYEGLDVHHAVYEGK